VTYIPATARWVWRYKRGNQNP